MKKNTYITQMAAEIPYAVVTLIYVIKLHFLNTELKAERFENALELLMYRDWIAMKYFVAAGILFLSGCLCIAYRVSRIRIGDYPYQEMKRAIAAIVLVVCLLLLIIIFINNPILRAVFIMALTFLGLFVGRK